MTLHPQPSPPEPTLDESSLIQRLLAHTDLGHAKRNQAFVRQVQLALDHPGAPPTQGAGGLWPNLLSFYRFANNPLASLDELRAIRRQVVLDSIAPDQELLLVHDVSLLDYSTHQAKTDRRVIGDQHGLGYEYASVTAFSAADGQFLGVLHDSVINDRGPDDAGAMDYDDPLFAELPQQAREQLPQNHRHQFATHVRGLAPHLAGRRVIHVADREFDDLFDLLAVREAGQDFVVRVVGNRNVMTPAADWIPAAAHTTHQAGHPLEPGWVCVDLAALAQAVALSPYKRLGLDGQGRVSAAAAPARLAELAIGACPVCLYRQAVRQGHYLKPPQPVKATLVVIREPAPPEGVEPLCWLLLTSLPTATTEQLTRVGWIYERRWGTENYYRLLKSGYRVEDSRLSDGAKVGRLLVIVSLAAMVLARLKAELGLGARGDLDDAQYARLKQARAEPDNEQLDLGERLYALAATLGGWLGRRRDPIGPTVLMRGMLQLLTALELMEQHRHLLEEVLRKPEIRRKLFCV